MNWTSIGTWLTSAPAAAINTGLLVSVLLALVLGRALAAHLKRTPKGDADTFLLSSVLGLLALLLGFTFALSIDRFEIRRVLVQDEANAISTAYTRAQLLEEPHRSRIRDILYRYTSNRIALARAVAGQHHELLATNDQLIAEFWSASADAFPSISNLDFSTAFVESVNEVINTEATRKSARVARVPAGVFVLLFVYAVASAAMLGVVTRGKHAFGMAASFLVLLALSLMLVLDIDRPASGSVQEAQGPMERVLGTMAASQ